MNQIFLAGTGTEANQGMVSMVLAPMYHSMALVCQLARTKFPRKRQEKEALLAGTGPATSHDKMTWGVQVPLMHIQAQDLVHPQQFPRRASQQSLMLLDGIGTEINRGRGLVDPSQSLQWMDLD